jgi:hypothetical protein
MWYLSRNAPSAAINPATAKVKVHSVVTPISPSATARKMTPAASTGNARGDLN